MFKMSPFLCILCKRLRAAIAAKSWSLFATQSNDKDIWAAEVDKVGLDEAYACWRADRAASLAKFRKLAEAGSVWAMTCLNLEDHGVDKAEAEKWYRCAYEHGSDRGLVYLAYLYLKEERLSEAESVLRAGVERGLSIAKYQLASIYLKRPTTPEKLTSARILLEEAAEQGDDYAADLLAKLLVRGRFGFMRIPAGVKLSVSILKRLDTLVALHNDYDSLARSG